MRGGKTHWTAGKAAHKTGGRGDGVGRTRRLLSWTSVPVLRAIRDHHGQDAFKFCALELKRGGKTSRDGLEGGRSRAARRDAERGRLEDQAPPCAHKPIKREAERILYATQASCRARQDRFKWQSDNGMERSRESRSGRRKASGRGIVGRGRSEGEITDS